MPFKNGSYTIAPGAVTVEDEVNTLSKLGADWLISRNSGGQGQWPKIEAARLLGLPVGMIRRPKLAKMLVLSTIDDAVAWVARKS